MQSIFERYSLKLIQKQAAGDVLHILKVRWRSGFQAAFGSRFVTVMQPAIDEIVAKAPDLNGVNEALLADMAQCAAAQKALPEVILKLAGRLAGM